MDVQAIGLHKKYAEGFELGPAEFSVPAGTACGVFGKNGSGKSTLIHLLTGNLDATKGEVRLGEQRMVPHNAELRAKVGFLPQASMLPPWQSANELMQYAAKIQGTASAQRSIDKQMQRWGVSDFADRAISQCSGGMQKRIGLAIVSLLDSPLTVLDEPFTGLDVWYCRQLFEWLQERKKSAKTTLICTHHLSYLARLADVGIFVEGGNLRVIDQIDNENWQQQTSALEEMVV